MYPGQRADRMVHDDLFTFSGSWLRQQSLPRVAGLGCMRYRWFFISSSVCTDCREKHVIKEENADSATCYKLEPSSSFGALACIRTHLRHMQKSRSPHEIVQSSITNAVIAALSCESGMTRVQIHGFQMPSLLEFLTSRKFTEEI
jgi:hypothetical protein